MLIFLGMVFCCFWRAFFRKFYLQPPDYLFILIIGLIWGITEYYYEIIEKFTPIIRMNPFYTGFVYITILVFRTAFCIDVHTFLRTLSQIMIIAVPISLFTCSLTGMVMMYLIDKNWDYITGLYFGALLIPIFVTHVTHRLRELTTRSTHTINLLEGETLVTIASAILIDALITGNKAGLVVHWYQFLAVTSRYVFFAIISGYVFSVFARLLLRKLLVNMTTTALVLMGFPVLCYFFASELFGGSGSMATITFGVIMARERSIMSNQTEDTLLYMWKTLAGIIVILVGIQASLEIADGLLEYMRWKDCILVFVMYFAYYIARFIGFILFAPVLSRLGSGMSFRNLLLCVWSGCKSPISIILVMRAKFGKGYMDDDLYHTLMFYTGSIFFFSSIINGGIICIVLKVLGLTELTLARQINMNNCLKHIWKKKIQTINVLKKDTLLADADWDLIIKANNLKHPYAQSGQSTEDEDDFFMGYRYAFCADCKKDVLQEPTAKEKKEMIREAKMRILKAKKMSYSRQYENDMITHESIKILTHAVDIAMETEEAIIVLDGLHNRFNEESCFRRFLKKRIMNLAPDEFSLKIRPPLTYWRRKCYHVVVNKKFEYFMYGVILINIIPICFNIWHYMTHYAGYKDETTSRAIFLAVVIMDAIFYSIYFTEFWMKIMAYSHLEVCKDGFGQYFKSVWNIIDFTVLVVNTINMLLDFYYLYTPDETMKLWIFNIILELLRFLRLLKIFHGCKDLQPRVVRYLETNMNSRMAFTYELGRSYVAGEDEVLEMLPYMIDHDGIRKEMQDKIEDDRLSITKSLGLVQQDKPWIAITVKTKQAIRTTLRSMKSAIGELKSSGWVDDYEEWKLMVFMDELYKNVNMIKSVQPSAPKVIFREVEWMANDEDVIDFLFENVTVKNFQPGDVVFDEGAVADGIYIIVTGLLIVEYIPSQSAIDNLTEFGELPIADFIACDRFFKSTVEYIISGNCVGEYSTLTRRPYNARISADTHTQVYVLSYGVLRRAMALNPDLIYGLECRMWKSVTTKIFTPLLLTIPMYHASPYQARSALERSFVPDLPPIHSFIVSDIVQNIILIEGVVADAATREEYVAPCTIPRTIHKLILPSTTGSLLNIPIELKVKMLIIPNMGIEDYDMVMTDGSCEMIGVSADTKCLQHIVKDRKAKQDRHRTYLRKRPAKSLTERSTSRSSADINSVYLSKESDTASVRMVADDQHQARSTLHTSISQYFIGKKK